MFGNGLPLDNLAKFCVVLSLALRMSILNTSHSEISLVLVTNVPIILGCRARMQAVIPSIVNACCQFRLLTYRSIH